MNVKRYTLEEWKPLAREVHLLCFNEDREDDMNTFDFALMVTNDQDVPQCYCTYIELDKYSCYMQHGGTFPSARGTAVTARGYMAMLKWLHAHYPRITTKTKNTNIPMLKLAMAGGFVIHGLDVYQSDIFVRLINDREDVKEFYGSR